jgi:hypothetical protein
MDIRPPERTPPPFARAKPRDRTLLRIAGWGLGAACAVTALVIAAQSPAGGARIKLAIAELNAPARPAAAASAARPQADPLLRTLEARIAQLAGDRDRLASRVAALEGGFDDLTGSVRKSAAASNPGMVPPAPAPGAAVAAKPVLPMVVAVAPPLINPLATPPAGVASILPDPPPATPGKAPEAAAPAPSAASASASEPVPLPPERVAVIAPAAAPKPAAAPARPHPEFGIELATEPTMDGLRQRWASVKANYGPLLIGLSPVAVRDQHPGSSAVRLVAGPLPSIAAARKLCARFAAMTGDCWPARINPADVVQR